MDEKLKTMMEEKTQYTVGGIGLGALNPPNNCTVCILNYRLK